MIRTINPPIATVAYKAEFPLMFAVARDFLLIPGAKVDVKRLFNIARDILNL
jgi:hypothetical protein